MSVTVTEKQIKQEQRNYLREWRSKNKDKVKAYNRSYWERRAAKAQEARASQEENGN